MKRFTFCIVTAIVFGQATVWQAVAADQQEAVPALGASQVEAQQQIAAVVNEEQLLSPEQMSSEQIRTLQQSLQEQGVDPGPIDGVMGARTGRALREFQVEKGLAATGQVNGQTLEALHLEVGKFMGIAPGFEIDQKDQMEKEAPPPGA